MLLANMKKKLIHNLVHLVEVAVVDYVTECVHLLVVVVLLLVVEVVKGVVQEVAVALVVAAVVLVLVVVDVRKLVELIVVEVV